VYCNIKGRRKPMGCINPISIIACVVGIVGCVIGVATFISAQIVRAKELIMYTHIDLGELWQQIY